MTKNNNLLKDAAIQIGSGGSAGLIEVCIMHPLDLVKTRLQLQSLKTKNIESEVYRGVFDCMKKMYQQEGFTSFYKGILPPILVETPKRAIKFMTFEQYKQLFMFGSAKPTPLTYSCAGFFAGVTEAFLVTPFETVKVTLQANRSKSAELPSTFTVARQIVQEHGLFGHGSLFKGFIATMYRGSVFNGVYFGFYHSVKDLIPATDHHTADFFKKLAIGFISGTLGSCANIPIDVAKSRIQGPQPNPPHVKYKTLSGTILTVYKEEGFLALYKGLVPKVMRLGPGGAIMLLVFEYMQTFLRATFN